MTWILFTLLAAFMQAWRNALQKKLSDRVSALGVTLARFIYAAPMAALYLLILHLLWPAKLPHFSAPIIKAMIIASVAQIAATGLMVILFQRRNYAIGVGLAKSEAIIAAALGAWFFAAPLTPFGWVGVLIGSVAVWLLSMPKARQALSLVNLAIGLASGLCFALTTLWLRDAALALKAQQLPFSHAAAWVLLFMICLQTLLLIIWLAKREPNALKAMWVDKRAVGWISFFSCVGSIGWFSAMSLQTVAIVKTLGQIEILFTLAISSHWFKEKLTPRETTGLCLIALSVIFVLWH